jgi:hypothetical protein
MSKAWQGGSTRAWRKARARVLARDGWQCMVKVPGVCTHVATCVHHVLGRSITGDDPSHMVASCTECNLSIGDPTTAPDPPPTPATKW